MKRPFRVLYALGPGDAVKSFKSWREGADFVGETQLTFSGQFFDFCREHGVEGYAISSHPAREVVRDGDLIVENRPKLMRDPGGIRYHVNLGLYLLSLLATALRFGARAVIVDSGTTHWFYLALFAPFRIRVIPSMHNVFWVSGTEPRGGLNRVILALDGRFWRHCASATLGVSPECQRQVEQIARGRAGPFFQFRSQFRPADFGAVPPPPPHDLRPFRVAYAGRIEASKGVFDLLAMAETLDRESPGRWLFEVCGDGAARDELVAEIGRRDLGAVVHYLGRLDRPALLAAYGRSHAIIVPTRSQFCEGMPAVLAEATLTGRPVISSRVTNGLDVLEGAIVEAEPDDLQSYLACLRRLMADRPYYEAACRACPACREQFYDRDKGWTAACTRAFRATVPGFAAPIEQAVGPR